jgi:hypothetical protein
MLRAILRPRPGQAAGNDRPVAGGRADLLGSPYRSLKV